MLVPTAAIIIGFIYIKLTLPKLIQGVLNDVGNQLTETFAKPSVARAMGIIGAHGHESQSDNALREKVAEKVVSESPVIGKALEYFGISPVEGLKLMNDPLLAPLIQGFLNKTKTLNLGGGNVEGGALP